MRGAEDAPIDPNVQVMASEKYYKLFQCFMQTNWMDDMKNVQPFYHILLEKEIKSSASHHLK